MEVPTLSALISCAKVKLAWSETWFNYAVVNSESVA